MHGSACISPKPQQRMPAGRGEFGLDLLSKSCPALGILERCKI